jgi:hypothetical protein
MKTKTTNNPFHDGTATLPRAKRRAKPKAPAPKRLACRYCEDTALVDSDGWCIECWDRQRQHPARATTATVQRDLFK